MTVFKDLIDKLNGITQEIEQAEQDLRDAPMLLPYSATYALRLDRESSERTLYWHKFPNGWRICLSRYKRGSGTEVEFYPLSDASVRSRLLLAPFISDFVKSAERECQKYLDFDGLVQEAVK